MAAARTLGRAGEAAVGIAGNTQLIAWAAGTAAYRIPHIVNPASKVIGEVKNVSSLSSILSRIPMQWASQPNRCAAGESNRVNV
jgi:hypothetical protein